MSNPAEESYDQGLTDGALSRAARAAASGVMMAARMKTQKQAGQFRAEARDIERQTDKTVRAVENHAKYGR